MSVDSITLTLSLPNGVKLTWPVNLGNLELSTSADELHYSIVPQKGGSIRLDFIPPTDGKTSSIFSGSGQNLDLELPFIEDSSIAT